MFGVIVVPSGIALFHWVSTVACGILRMSMHAETHQYYARCFQLSSNGFRQCIKKYADILMVETGEL